MILTFYCFYITCW